MKVNYKKSKVMAHRHFI